MQQNFYLDELKGLLNTEFSNDNVLGITKMDNALTAIVYKIDFKGKSFIAKIGYDPREIAIGKGEREKKAIELANKILGSTLSPKLVCYYKNYRGFPGYITFIEKLEGRILSPTEFNKLASTDSNISVLVDTIQGLHNYRDKHFNELIPNSANNVHEYFIDKFNKIKSDIEKANLNVKMDEGLSLLPKIFEYFKNYDEYSFIHGDINYKNVLMEGNKISSLIDWDRSLIAPIGFEFAQVSTLTEKYGVSNWHKKLMKSYLDSYVGNAELLQKEFELIQYFVYFLLLARKLTHISQKDKIEICVETGEEFKDHLIRKITEYKLPKI